MQVEFRPEDFFAHKSYFRPIPKAVTRSSVKKDALQNL